MSYRTRISKSLIAAATLASVALGTSSVFACGGAWVPFLMDDDINHRIDGVARAEKKLEAGGSLNAAASVIRMMPHIRNIAPGRSKLTDRAQRILAVSLSRNGGALLVGEQVPAYALDGWDGKSSEQREENLQWAVGTLRAQSEKKSDDPVLKVELAEALSRVDTYRSEAKQILEGMAKRDLIPSARGYAVVSELRKAEGDTAGAQRARERCLTMAKDASVCGEAQPSQPGGAS